jgi:hypothetical protein
MNGLVSTFNEPQGFPNSNSRLVQKNQPMNTTASTNLFPAQISSFSPFGYTNDANFTPGIKMNSTLKNIPRSIVKMDQEVTTTIERPTSRVEQSFNIGQTSMSKILEKPSQNGKKKAKKGISEFN